MTTQLPPTARISTLPTLTTLLTAALLACTCMPQALAQTSLPSPETIRGIVVITSTATPINTLSREQVANIFLGRANPDEKWKPIDSSSEPLRQRFYQLSANMSANRARAVWARLVFASRAIPPRQMTTDTAAATAISEPYGITYIEADRPPPNGKVLLRLP
jgi:ABC-type phosphate transport system substrate-binding protein